MGEFTSMLQFDVAAGIGLVGTLSYYLFYKFAYRKIIKPHTELIDKAIKAMPKIDKIHSEFYTNGGSSMKDSMIRIENSLTAVSQKQYVYLLEHELGIFETDGDGNFIDVNRTYCRMIDRTENECRGTNWLHFVHHDDRDEVEDEWNRAVKGGRDFRMAYKIVISSGKELEVFMSAHPMRNKVNGIIIGFMGTIKFKKGE